MYQLLILCLIGLLCGPRAAPANDAPPLEAIYWRLVSFGDEALVIEDGDTPPHIALHSETKRVAGFGGCNRFFGRYMVDGAKIKIEPLGGGRGNCSRTSLLEQQFITALGRASVYRIESDHLYLEVGATRVVFRALIR